MWNGIWLQGLPAIVRGADPYCPVIIREPVPMSMGLKYVIPDKH